MRAAGRAAVRYQTNIDIGRELFISEKTVRDQCRLAGLITQPQLERISPALAPLM